MLALGHSARGTGHILVGDVQCSRECQICALFQPNPVTRAHFDTVCTPEVLDELSGAQTIRKSDNSHAVCDILLNLINQSPDRSSYT